MSMSNAQIYDLGLVYVPVDCLYPVLALGPLLWMVVLRKHRSIKGALWKYSCHSLQEFGLRG